MLQSQFSSSAKELVLDFARKSNCSYSIILEFGETFISTDTDNFLGLVLGLRDLLKFVRDDDEALKHYIFDANVRDFQGSVVEVNNDIAETLAKHYDDLNFGWLKQSG